MSSKKCALLGFLKKPMGGKFLNFGRGRGIVATDAVADDSYVIADSIATAPSTTTSTPSSLLGTECRSKAILGNGDEVKNV